MLQSTWLINGLVCAARVIHKANGHAFRSSLTDLHRDSSCLITSLTAPPPVPLSVQSNISCGLLPCRLPIKVTHYPGRSTFPLLSRPTFTDSDSWSGRKKRNKIAYTATVRVSYILSSVPMIPLLFYSRSYKVKLLRNFSHWNDYRTIDMSIDV